MPQNKAEIAITERSTTDSLGRQLSYRFPPQRIVSLCPSQTETLFALGLEREIAGLTRYCLHPQDKVGRVAQVGGTKQLKMEAVRELAPDLVIAEKEENRREDVEALTAEWPVFVTDVRNIDGALGMIRSLGDVCDRRSQADALAASIEQRLARLVPLRSPLRVAYLIWRKPWMAAGRDTYIHSVLERCGFTNVFAGHAARYPEFNAAELAALNPQVVMLSSEPYPFSAEHVREFQAMLPQAESLLVNGESFSWYGARMLPAADDLQRVVDGFKT